MSRTSYSTEKYVLAFGVDHTPMGAFLQVWDKSLPDDDYDLPAVEVDSMFGVRTPRQEALDTNPRLKGEVRTLQGMYQQFKQRERCYPNLSVQAVVRVARTLGFNAATLSEIERHAYQLWD